MRYKVDLVENSLDKKNIDTIDRNKIKKNKVGLVEPEIRLTVLQVAQVDMVAFSA